MDKSDACTLLRDWGYDSELIDGIPKVKCVENLNDEQKKSYMTKLSKRLKEAGYVCSFGVAWNVQQ